MLPGLSRAAAISAGRLCQGPVAETAIALGTAASNPIWVKSRITS